MGTHLSVLSESYSMNTNMTGRKKKIQKIFRLCALDESSLSIGRVMIETLQVLKRDYEIESLYLMCK